MQTPPLILVPLLLLYAKKICSMSIKQNMPIILLSVGTDIFSPARAALVNHLDFYA